MGECVERLEGDPDTSVGACDFGRMPVAWDVDSANFECDWVDGGDGTGVRAGHPDPVVRCLQVGHRALVVRHTLKVWTELVSGLMRDTVSGVLPLPLFATQMYR